MAWFFLLIAGLFEVAWAVGMKLSDGFTRLWPTLITLVTAIISFVFLGLAQKDLPLGTSYAVWVGIGAVGTAAMGMILFGESRDPVRLACLALIVAGVIGLRLTTSEG